jgi:superoxide dismutase, Fe-Mn family
MAEPNLSRRTVLTAAATLPLARLAGATTPVVEEEAPIQTGGPFTLPPLPYAADALEKAIDAQTMTIHHDRHHAAYVTNLNAAIAKAPAEFQKMSVEELLAKLDKLPGDIREAVRNNGGGHYNHSVFWTIMSPQGGGEPVGRVKEIIDGTFGGFENFKMRFEDAAMKRFGSGWVWLAQKGDGEYAISSRPNQDSPIIEGLKPIFGNDVWEHAYYLRYQNRRADYLKAWWNVVNWAAVNERLAHAEAA